MSTVLAKLSNDRLVKIESSALQFIAGASMLGELHGELHGSHETLSLTQVIAIAALPRGQDTRSTVAAILAHDAATARALVPERDCLPPCTTNVAVPIPGVTHPNQVAILEWLYGPAGPHPFP